MAKTVFLLASAASLVGGVACSLVTAKATATIDVNVTAKAGADISLDSLAKAGAESKTAAKPKVSTKKMAKGGSVKGSKTMTTINNGHKNDWYKASSLLGE